MNDLYVMGELCSRNKLNKRSLARLEMTLGKLGVTRGKNLILCLFGPRPVAGCLPDLLYSAVRCHRRGFRWCNRQDQRV